MERKDSGELMKKIGYTFKNEEYLKEALIHRSFSNESDKIKKIDNEKLEFLGDAVVNLIMTEYIYYLEKDKSEGELAKLKGQIISGAVFSAIASEIQLGEYLYLSNGEIASGGRNRKSILGDAFEALIGAVFKDSDYYTTREVALRLLSGKINNLEEIDGIGDHKTILQETCQSIYRKIPEYEIIKTEGPDHDKIFEVAVKLNDQIKGTGIGKSKKQAEKNAAREALKNIDSAEKKQSRKAEKHERN